MKRLLFGFCLFCLVSNKTATAQLKKMSGDPHLVAKFRTEAAKNAEYVKMRNQLASLVKTASPKNTNAAAVKALLARNNRLLKGLYTNAGIEPPQVKSANVSSHLQIMRTNKEILSMNISKFKPLNPLLKVIKPPYDDKAFHHNNYAVMDPDTVLSNFATGKIAMSLASDGWAEEMGLGLNNNIFQQEITIPSNPLIVAAEIKLEFSYLYTGWDTYGSVRALYTLLRTQGLEDVQNSAWPEFDFKTGSYFPPFRITGAIQPLDSIQTDFDDFIISGSDSIVMHRYILPGAKFNLEFGLGIPYDTRRGEIGCYHYAEMTLKRITIKYLKAGE